MKKQSASTEELIKTIHVVSNINKRKQTDQAMPEEINKYGFLFNHAPDSIVLLEINEKENPVIVDVNIATCNMYGYMREEIIGKPIEFLYNNDVGQVISGVPSLSAGEKIIFEANHIRKDNMRLALEVSAQLIKLNTKSYVLAINRDITKRKYAENEIKKSLQEKDILLKDINRRKKNNIKTYKDLQVMQDQLIQSEKMAALGQLSAGIAHEFNNLLGIMSGYVQFAQRTLEKQDMLDALKIVSVTSERAGRIIKNLMFFSSKKLPKVELYDICDIVERVICLIESQLEKQNIKIIRKYDKVPKIKINVIDMQQVFLNLILNARDAMLPKNGTLIICIKREGNIFSISFQDTGEGIRKEVIGRIFDPFFTTKGALGGGKVPGTGLGLSISYTIIKKHGGDIQAESKPGKGATFTIRLPIKKVKNVKPVIGTEKMFQKKKVKPQKILVVDDEIEICNMLSNYLNLEKHKVVAVNNGEKALKILKSEQFDVILLDVLMPGIDGYVVLKEIKKKFPKTKVIVITGTLENPVSAADMKKAGADCYVCKPFDMDKINYLIR
jgi:PAS domain S-box-containing protein